MSHAFTPQGYASQIQKYKVGDPRRTVAVMRAVFAGEAARAARDGDYGRASQALNGLHKLTGFGALDTTALASRITASMNIATNALPEDAKSIARNQATAAQISGIIGLIGPLAQGLTALITAASSDPGARVVGSWINFLLGGGTFAMTENDAKLAKSFCRGYANASAWVNGILGGVTGLINLAAINADAGTQRDIQRALAIVSALQGWLTTAFDTICREVNAAVPDTTTPVCAPASGIPTGGAAGCCPGLIYRADIDRCVTALPAEPTARVAWTRAVDARRTVEAVLANPEAFSAEAVAAAQARDGTTAYDMCEAEKALLATVATIPQRGTPATPETIDGVARRMAAVREGTATGADRLGLGIGLAAMFNYLPPSAKPRCYIVLPPTSGCPAGCGSSGVGGAGAIVALALPVAAFAWYMMK